MRSGDVPGDGETQTCSALILIARLVQAIEGPKYVLAMGRRNADAVVVDDDRDEPWLAFRHDSHVVGVALRVGDEVADTTLHRDRTHPNGEIPVGLEGNRGPMPLCVRAQVLEQSGNVGLGRGFGRVATGEGEISLEH